MNSRHIFKKNIIKFALILFVIGVIGCTRDSLNSKILTESFNITPRVPGHNITFNSNVTFLPNVPNENLILFENTEELFSFLNNIIDIGKKHSNRDLIELGHNLTDKFYSKEDHFSYYGWNRTPYSYLFFEEDAKNEYVILNHIKYLSKFYLSEIKDVIENNNWGIAKFTKIENIEDYDLSRYFDEVVNFVGRIDDALTDRGSIDPIVIDAIGGIAETAYVPAIRALEVKIMSKINIENSLEDNIENARELINNNELIANSPMYEDIKLALDNAEGKELGFFKGIFYWVDVNIFGYQIDTETFLIAFANFFVNNLHNIPRTLANIFEQEFNRILNDDKEFREKTHEVIGSLFNQIAFDGEFAPAIEYSDIQTVLNSENNIAFNKDNSSSGLKQTTASTWALSMPLALERLRNLQENNNNIFGLKYKQILLSLINKSTSAIGYIKDEKDPSNLYNGLFFPFDRSETTSNPRIDIRTYYTDNQPYFGIPDSMVVKNGFEIDYDNSNASEIKTSVSAQADYIIAMTETLDFLRPDIKHTANGDKRFNSFDLSLGVKAIAVEAIGDEEIEPFSIFPKESVFLLHLGLVSVVFTNLKKKGTYLYNEKGEYKTLTIDDLQNADDIYMISISDVIDDEQSDKIITKDISKYIIAIDKLLSFINSINIDNINDQNLKNTFNDPVFKESKDLMTKMMLGLGFLMTAKLQLPEGGFYDSYYLDTEFGEQTYSLDTQVHAIKGLLAVHNHRWESDLIKLVITDTYRTMNQKLFDEDLGFYKIDEKQKAMPDLNLTLETIQMLYELDGILPREDLNDLRQNREFWLKRFVDQVKILE